MNKGEMAPLLEARIGDLGPEDRLHIQCVCQNVVIFPPRFLLEGMGLRPDDRIADLTPWLRCRQCGERGKAVVSVRTGV